MLKMKVKVRRNRILSFENLLLSDSGTEFFYFKFLQATYTLPARPT